MSTLAQKIKTWGLDLGFQQIGFTHTDLSAQEKYLLDWLKRDFHGEMAYMQNHGTKRSRPDELIEGTTSIISVTLDYWPEKARNALNVLDNSEMAYLSRYALGRDYHKVMRNRLQNLANKIQQEFPDFRYRVFVDSAPVLEKAIAENAGLGWIGKHTNLLQEKLGSWFFLGEIYTNLDLPFDEKATNHCGTCNACIDACPTKAIIAPYRLDARRCISYLTIEHRGSIPVEFRKNMGNRIYGCDDCQLVCPWNRFSRDTLEKDFGIRYELDSSELITLFNWEEKQFYEKMEGSAIRRIGYECWLRNIAIALGNATTSDTIITALNSKKNHASELVREHVIWALDQHGVI